MYYNRVGPNGVQNYYPLQGCTFRIPRRAVGRDITLYGRANILEGQPGA